MLSIQRLLVFRHIWSEGNALEAKVLGHLQKHRDAPSASECDPEKDVESLFGEESFPHVLRQANRF